MAQPGGSAPIFRTGRVQTDKNDRNAGTRRPRGFCRFCRCRPSSYSKSPARLRPGPHLCGTSHSSDHSPRRAVLPGVRLLFLESLGAGRLELPRVRASPRRQVTPLRTLRGGGVAPGFCWPALVREVRPRRERVIRASVRPGGPSAQWHHENGSIRMPGAGRSLDRVIRRRLTRFPLPSCGVARPPDGLYRGT